jgi:hydrogenase maturation factor
MGDLIILSGTIADHGMAVLSKRQGLEFATD